MSKVEHKHQLRLVFHQQLMRLWATTEAPKLGKSSGRRPIGVAGGKAGPVLIHSSAMTAEQLAEIHVLDGWSFVPLVTRELDLWCGIDVLFLRPAKSGSLLKKGDLDGRLKTLLDALSIPDRNQKYATREVDSSPLYTLLEDDKLVSKVSVETDELLELSNNGSDDITNLVRLVISVKIRPREAHFGNIQFL